LVKHFRKPNVISGCA